MPAAGITAATVDIGTNSVLLLVAEFNLQGQLTRIVDERCSITRLGQDLDRPGRRLAPAAVQRTLSVLEAYATVMTQLEVERKAAIGTAVLRAAADSESFRSQAEAVLGCPLEIISGQREAELAWAGVRGAFGDLPPGTLVIDVGGGSTELVLQTDSGVASVSLPLGAVHLSKLHLQSDPPACAELTSARLAVQGELSRLPDPLLRPVAQLIGLAGTVTTLATVELSMEVYDTKKVNGLWLERSRLDEQIRRFASLSLEKRRCITGLEPARADVILGGALIVEGIMVKFQTSGLKVCDRGVRWGRIWELTTSS